MIRIEKQSLSGKKLDLCLVGFDRETRVNSMKLSEKNLTSESELIVALQSRMKKLDDGMYSLHPNNELFARFRMVDNVISNLEKRSQNTGVVMPCWTYFEN